MLFEPAAVKSLPIQYTIRLEMDSVGLAFYKAKGIKQIPGLVGIARDLGTVGCMTVRETRGTMDIAVYPCLSLREVIGSLVTGDGVAAVNCAYFNNLRAAAQFLRQYKE